MSSIIEGYNYDIFISYRQKDNKHDGWVTEFVNILKGELESTFKEEISVYFDENPHDGLLETHDVDASLNEKLKCLIFIPIISRTYCDPKSYAWEHEFKAFVEKAFHDKFGLKVKLPNGNIASRVLPVQIHELDSDDNSLLERELGGSLRGIEFIYREPGVNKPLTSEDDATKNKNNTKFKIQINKVGNAVKEIIAGLKGEPVNKIPAKIALPQKQIISEKSIIVLPFENMSSDPDQEYFSDGLTEEIISDLSQVHDLLVISRSSAMTFKGSKKKIIEIAADVRVHYVLEGSVRKSGNDIRITAQLIDGSSDAHIWAEKFNGTLEDIFDIQEKVSRSIVDALKIKINNDEKQRIKARSIENVFAYDCYLRAYREIMSFTKERIELGLELLQKGIDITGENALIYAGMAFAHFQYANMGIEQEYHSKKSEELVKKALDIDPDIAEAHFVFANILLAFYGNPRDAINHFNKANLGNPGNPEIMIWLAWCYQMIGKPDAAMFLIESCVKIDPLNPMYDTFKGLNYFMTGKFDLALNPLLEVYKLFPDASMWQLWKTLALMYNDRPTETYDFLNEAVREPGPDSIARLLIFLKYGLHEDKEKMASLLTPEFIKTMRLDCQYSWHMASFYSYFNESDKAFEWLENSIERGFINYPMLNTYDRLLNNVRGDKRFGMLMKRAKTEWQNFKM